MCKKLTSFMSSKIKSFESDLANDQLVLICCPLKKK